MHLLCSYDISLRGNSYQEPVPDFIGTHILKKKRWGRPISDSLGKENHSQYHDENERNEHNEGFLQIVHGATSLERVVESTSALVLGYVQARLAPYYYSPIFPYLGAVSRGSNGRTNGPSAATPLLPRTLSQVRLPPAGL